MFLFRKYCEYTYRVFENIVVRLQFSLQKILVYTHMLSIDVIYRREILDNSLIGFKYCKCPRFTFINKFINA